MLRKELSWLKSTLRVQQDHEFLQVVVSKEVDVIRSHTSGFNLVKAFTTNTMNLNKECVKPSDKSRKAP